MRLHELARKGLRLSRLPMWPEDLAPEKHITRAGSASSTSPGRAGRRRGVLDALHQRLLTRLAHKVGRVFALRLLYQDLLRGSSDAYAFATAFDVFQAGAAGSRRARGRRCGCAMITKALS